MKKANEKQEYIGGAHTSRNNFVRSVVKGAKTGANAAPIPIIGEAITGGFGAMVGVGHGLFRAITRDPHSKAIQKTTDALLDDLQVQWDDADKISIIGAAVSTYKRIKFISIAAVSKSSEFTLGRFTDDKESIENRWKALKQYMQEKERENGKETSENKNNGKALYKAIADALHSHHRIKYGQQQEFIAEDDNSAIYNFGSSTNKSQSNNNNSSDSDGDEQSESNSKNPVSAFFRRFTLTAKQNKYTEEHIKNLLGIFNKIGNPNHNIKIMQDVVFKSSNETFSDVEQDVLKTLNDDNTNNTLKWVALSNFINENKNVNTKLFSIVMDVLAEDCNLNSRSSVGFTYSSSDSE